MRGPVLGQEAVASGHGLGRVTNLVDLRRGNIGVTPYVAGYEMQFSVHNVKLVEIRLVEEPL